MPFKICTHDLFTAINLRSVWFRDFGREGNGGDILNFYIWFNFLTRGEEGRR
jgi:hypothetical protein